MTMRTPRHAGRLARRAVAAAAAMLLFAGCDVTNPGLILDADLNNRAAQTTLLNGVVGAFQLAMNQTDMDISILLGEIAGGASTDQQKHQWYGTILPTDADLFNGLYAAVWVAENSVNRMKTVYGNDPNTGWQKQPNMAETFMWAGFANRLAGETLCKAVFEGGPAQPRTAYFTRAESAFTNAIKVAEAIGTAANTTRLAAYGGRASVRLIVGNWAGAVADAGVVPTTFVRQVPMSKASTRERNVLFEETHTTMNLNSNFTWFAKYYADTKDPRTVVVPDPRSAGGATLYMTQKKYAAWDAGINITSGIEMRLIEAENQIVNGDWVTGLAMLNAIRAAVPMPPVTATTKADAFMALRLERAVVLWLEARRGGDVLRWGGKITDDPIMIYFQQFIPNQTVPLASRPICEPFSQVLLATNPNLTN